MLTAISLRCAIESPKPSQSCLKKAVCLQKGLVHAVRHWLDLDETQLDSHILIFPKDLRWKKKFFVSHKVLQTCSEVILKKKKKVLQWSIFISHSIWDETNTRTREKMNGYSSMEANPFLYNLATYPKGFLFLFLFFLYILF